MSNGNDLRELDKRLDILEAGPEEQKMNDFVEPTVDQPSLADLMEWDERGGCEATVAGLLDRDGAAQDGWEINGDQFSVDRIEKGEF